MSYFWGKKNLFESVTSGPWLRLKNPDLGKCINIHTISLEENGWQRYHPFWGVSNHNTRNKLSPLDGDIVESRHCLPYGPGVVGPKHPGIYSASGRESSGDRPPSLCFSLVVAHVPVATKTWSQFQGESSLYLLELHASVIKLSEWAGRAFKTGTLNASTVPPRGLLWDTQGYFRLQTAVPRKVVFSWR